MSDPLTDALNQIGEAGLLGAVTIVVLISCYWFVRRAQVAQDIIVQAYQRINADSTARMTDVTDRFISFLETKDAQTSQVTETLQTISHSLENLVRRQEETERQAEKRHEKLEWQIQKLMEDKHVGVTDKSA